MGVLIWIIGIALVVIILTTVLNTSYETEYTAEDLEISDEPGENNSEDDEPGPQEDTQQSSQDEESAPAPNTESPDTPNEPDTESSVTDTDVPTETQTSEQTATTSSQRIENANEPDTAGPTGDSTPDSDDGGTDTLQADDLLDLEDDVESSATDGGDSLELPFDPIHTFEPDPDQWSTLNEETSRVPWPEKETEDPDYDDTVNPTSPSKSIENAIEWLKSASTEAIHQADKRRQFLEYLRDFIKNPRAAGAQQIEKLEWRELNPNISRLIGDRLLFMALGLSCHGRAEMRAHLEALGEGLNDTWNNDGLEHPLIQQSIGRLGILTPTSLEDVQPTLTKRVAGRVPRSSQPGIIEEASYHAMLLAVSTGPDYPLKKTEDNLPRTWHWDGNNPPLASWEQLLPVLYTLWIYHWTEDDTGGAIKDIGPMLGSWWEENPPPDDFFEKNPEVWEGILMFTWATTGQQSHVWEQLRERYEETNFEDENLHDMTETYFEWAESYQDDGHPPDESFTGKRLPPLEWIRPLPSDIVRDFSQPSHEFPEKWCQDLTELSPPDVQEL